MGRTVEAIRANQQSGGVTFSVSNQKLGSYVGSRWGCGGSESALCAVSPGYGFCIPFTDCVS